MPDISFANQPFDLAFHPTSSVLYTSLLTGEIKSYAYSDDTGASSTGDKAAWTSRPSKKCVRGVVFNSEEGSGDGKLWAVGKSGGLWSLDPESGVVVEAREEAHSAPINTVANMLGGQVVTGDDEGVIKFWDPRQKDQIREFAHHWEYISDFVFHPERRQLVSTSGDGTISVIDVRSNKTTPLAISEDQEDELLSIVAIKGGNKHVVGSQLGVLSVWDKSKGWGDSVDRISGHPASVETLVALSEDIIATGSEDGMIRVMQVQPNKFLGVIATHGDFPIERIRLDRTGKWLGSVSHDDTLKMTDVSDLFEDSDDEADSDADIADDASDVTVTRTAAESQALDFDVKEDSDEDDEDEGMGAEDETDGDGDTAMDSDSDEEEEEDAKEERAEARRERKRAKKMERKEAKNLGLNGKPLFTPKEEAEVEEAKQNFFDDL